MSNTLQYKRYEGSVEFSSADNLFFGKILHINALIMYAGSSVAEIRAEFQNSVDDYMAACVAEQLEPERPFSGTFNVRVGAEIHRKASVAAIRDGVSLNKWVAAAIEKSVNPAEAVHQFARLVVQRVEEKRIDPGSFGWGKDDFSGGEDDGNQMLYRISKRAASATAH